MVKLTMVGRVKDGLPLAQGHRYVNNEQENDNFLCYKQQGEFIIKEISRGALTHSKMTVRIDHHSFNCMVVNGICFMTLCDSSYPRKLAFHYLQDLQKEFEKFDNNLINKITRPYSFVKFDGVIWNIRKQYIDTRTQANLSKLNANRHKDLDIITEHILEISQRKRSSEGSLASCNGKSYCPMTSGPLFVETISCTKEISERSQPAPRTVSPIWGSPLLEVIALKWTPITIILAVAVVLILASLILSDNYII